MLLSFSNHTVIKFPRLFCALGNIWCYTCPMTHSQNYIALYQKIPFELQKKSGAKEVYRSILLLTMSHIFPTKCFQICSFYLVFFFFYYRCIVLYRSAGTIIMSPFPQGVYILGIQNCVRNNLDLCI